MVGFPALLVDSGHKNSAKAHQMNLLDLLLPDMLDLSHSNARKDLQAAVQEAYDFLYQLFYNLSRECKYLKPWIRIVCPWLMAILPRRGAKNSIHMFSFCTKTIELMTKWMRSISRNCFNQIRIQEYACSLHFSPQDFCNISLDTNLAEPLQAQTISPGLRQQQSLHWNLILYQSLSHIERQYSELLCFDAVSSKSYKKMRILNP